MRTTLTLDPDVARMVEDAVHRERRPLKQVVNDAIRRGLAPRTRSGTAKAVRVQAHHARLQPGLDPLGFNRLNDELEDAAVIRKATRVAK